MSLPSYQKAAVIEGTELVIKKNAFIPSFEKNEVLVKVIAASVNPTDWKHIDYGSGKTQGSVSGCDYAGIIVSMGEEVEAKGDLNLGDHVYGVVHGSSLERRNNGAFAEFVAASPLVLIKAAKPLKTIAKGQENIPSGPVETFEGASTLGVALTTIAITFSYYFKFDFSKKPLEDDFLLIWGGSSSVGQIALQFAKIYGIKVIVVASAKNHHHLKSLGADHLVDYHDADAVEQIKALGKNHIKFGFDTISLPQTNQKVHSAVSENATTNSLLPFNPKDLEDYRSDVDITVTLAYLAWGKNTKVPFPWMETDENGAAVSNPGFPEACKTFFKVASKALNEGSVKHIPITVLPKGLNSLNEAFDLLRHDKISSGKLTVRIEDSA
ncbi:GroES-like protein [Nadsonia fulvescens var. elongata DSM 6958]|uniref:GroES-like protein n=1 Tax=Nadsonia fulvescens var. elongata DSM 6958 TaxID=857566 RepID=A0A1E3PEN4_9ASCO|nr:GroES-like protein [Nadsonia fulvescens var. elongata DSM 6958]